MLIPFFVILGLLVLVPTIIWGFPGVWALPAILPSFIGAATFKHVRLPRDQRAVGPNGVQGPAIRPGVMVLGGLFTLVTGVASLVLMWAAAAPSTVRIQRELRIDADVARVWHEVATLSSRPKWNTWIADTEPIGRGGATAIGSTYRATLALERYSVPAELVVTAFEPEARFTWQVKPQGGSALDEMLETIALEKVSAVATLVRYELAYEVPTVMGRVAERIAVRGSAERTAESMLELLRQRVLMPQ